MNDKFRSARLVYHLLFVLVLGVLAFLPDTQLSFAQTPSDSLISNFDADTQSLIAHADRVVFLIPFSHWDTDWHDTFDAYSKKADQNILSAIQLAKQYSRFRYTLEQVLFVQHFWDTHPGSRADLMALVHKHQIAFAWAGITQPETSLVAPSIQMRNLQLGQAWIAQTFGPEYVPRSAWQSDAFGNSAAFPTFLSESHIPYLYIGRWQGRCDPDYQKCQPLPPAFYWTSPAAPSGIAGRVLATYISYPTAWGDIYQRTDPDAQLKALRDTVEAEFKQTTSKYLFLPVGFDFFDPKDNLPALVDRWNAADQHTILVMSDADTAFQYLATQTLPEISVDLNPIWQAFYDTRPDAKIADKESEYYLTAGDKFGLFLNTTPSSAWNTAAINAHYDNVAGVSYNSVWKSSQFPRFEQTVTTAQNDLTNILSQIGNRVPAPVVIFNSTSWSRSEVVELTGDMPDVSKMPAPVQKISDHEIAFWAKDVPSLGYAGLSGGQVTINHPATSSQSGNHITLTNGLVSVTLDGDHGAAFSSLSLMSGANTPRELLSTFGDDVTYMDDKGDVYGASFGQERARESQVAASIQVVAAGPLIARAQATFTLGGQPVTKTVTVRADSPLIEVDLDISALPETTALLNTPTVLDTDARTDDLGFGAFTHAVDNKPIVPGDITYRRSIFYPITYWSDVSKNDMGLTLITHGLQGMAGSTIRSFMLVRQVTHDPEGVSDPGIHHLRYAYLPHVGEVADAQSWLAAYAFNQPLIPVWRAGGLLNVQLPFEGITSSKQLEALNSAPLPITASLFSVKNAIVGDLYRQDGVIEAVVIRYDLTTAATIEIGDEHIILPKTPLALISLPPLSLESLSR